MSVQTLRAATWNVHGLRGGVEAIASVIRAEEIDILMVQESGPRRRLRSLGETLGMIVCADPPAFPRRRVQDAVLVRPSRQVRTHRLVRFEGGSLVHPRGALIARLDGVTAVSVHLGLDPAERGRHAEQLLDMLREAAGTVVIGGDLNAHPQDATPTRVSAGYRDLWTQIGEGGEHTFPSDAPTARIDYLFAGPTVQPLRGWTAGGRVSDHLMVVADLRMEDGA